MDEQTRSATGGVQVFSTRERAAAADLAIGSIDPRANRTTAFAGLAIKAARISARARSRQPSNGPPSQTDRALRSDQVRLATYRRRALVECLALRSNVGELLTPKNTTTLNMGKRGLRFENVARNLDEPIGDLCSKMSSQKSVDIYEAQGEST